jgi:hypothetical protein
MIRRSRRAERGGAKGSAVPAFVRCCARGAKRPFWDASEGVGTALLERFFRRGGTCRRCEPPVDSSQDDRQRG